ncbi:hypothetical protein [Noviherbaspirillum pedocola]|uniref:Uncharacterized protein n=1 Tax=Noviherbaspirillum pedocola TaxID=2801341 RepID=A0A934W8J3_9BURK|nr:hypothetical protein [Noviherbaspirillum pedocola]MBK4738702.1 hypothetical protein [Noviherbaspirillum pedocola]
MSEILGRSRFGPVVSGCQAPDTGDAKILAHYMPSLNDANASAVLDSQDAEFRAAVRQFLARELMPELRETGRRCAGIYSDYLKVVRWHRILAKQS